MKRIGNLYDKILDCGNLVAADIIAQKGRSKKPEIITHNLFAGERITDLYNDLKAGSFKTSDYKTFTIRDPKERLIYKLPHYPDRIVHLAIVNIVEPILLSVFTADTYSCIKGRGIHMAAEKLKKALRQNSGNAYCLKFDIQKFYPSVNHVILKKQLEKKFKDVRLLTLLFEIIDSAPGLPIGNRLSQPLANFYLTPFDRWIKQVKKTKHYFRYADDIVILSDRKTNLHDLLREIKQYLFANLDLKVKSNHQIFPIAARGIDFLGYRFFHGFTLLRKRIKKNFAKAVKANRLKSLPSYNGWAKHCNSYNLQNKLKLT